MFVAQSRPSLLFDSSVRMFVSVFFFFLISALISNCVTLASPWPLNPPPWLLGRHKEARQPNGASVPEVEQTSIRKTRVASGLPFRRHGVLYDPLVLLRSKKSSLLKTKRRSPHARQRVKQTCRLISISERLLVHLGSYLSEEEMKAGATLKRNQYSDSNLLMNHLLLWSYIQKLMRTPWNIHLCSSGAAGTTPDGQIYISFDLAEKLTDDEVALLVGHEMAHVLFSDMENLYWFRLGRCYAEIFWLRIALAVSLDKALGTVGVRCVIVMMHMFWFEHDLLKKRRAMEFRADRMGLQIAKLAGYNPEEGARLLLKLKSFRAPWKWRKLWTWWLSSIFPTHPRLIVRYRNCLENHSRDCVLGVLELPFIRMNDRHDKASHLSGTIQGKQ